MCTSYVTSKSSESVTRHCFRSMSLCSFKCNSFSLSIYLKSPKLPPVKRTRCPPNRNEMCCQLRAWSHYGRFLRLSSYSAAFRERRQGYCRGMRPIIVCRERIDNLPKEADDRFCVKLRQRQVRNLLRDAHRWERVKKQVVQLRLSLLEKETCSD